MTEQETQAPAGGSLLDGIEAPASKPKPKRTISAKAKRRALIGTASVLVLGGATWAGIEYWPTPKPDFEFAPIDDVFGYTLLTDEFNKLPVEERIELVAQITRRLESMSGDDSLLMAAFFAGVMGEAREQLEENVSRLMVDTWDMHAVNYNNIPQGQRAEYLEDAVVQLIRLGDAFHGMAGDKSDEEILDTAYEQAAEDQQALSDPNRGPSSRGKARMFSMMNDTIGSNATPQQRARIGLFVRDMTAHLRGKDVGGG